MDKKGPLYLRANALATEAGVNPESINRLILAEILVPDGHVEWGVDDLTGHIRYRPLFLRSKVDVLVPIIKRYTRTNVKTVSGNGTASE